MLADLGEQSFHQGDYFIRGHGATSQ